VGWGGGGGGWEWGVVVDVGYFIVLVCSGCLAYLEYLECIIALLLLTGKVGSGEFFRR
jgi:hypothetical protein